ncbi:glycosyltransferase family 4 protein [Pedobacter nototheniae]|uniref:glycosyltransferase family 4 protein n=1 Tax=Pedobacter nototheniae TaxID=2488994 RepID=UPI00292CF04B|nr:glycosyltransferase family 4 protein [Pedobacter nototheniae]
MPFRLAILVSHPIQYYAPVFKLLAADESLDLKVFYTLGHDNIEDKGFGKNIIWDVPLLEGYEYEFLENTSSQPGSHHYKGIKNPDIIAKINAFKPDALLVYGWSYKSHLKAISYFHGKIPIWFRGDSTLLNNQPAWKKIIRRFFLSRIYKKIDLAFYVGANNKAYFLAAGLAESQLKHAPHAIDNKRFTENRNTEALKLRTELGLSEQDALVVFAGKLAPVKNPELLLDAFISLNQPNTHLLLVGNGILENSLKSKVQKLSTNNITFIDFQNQSQMPIIYQACDVFCLPSLNETWGLAVNEAMAAGKPVLVSDAVGCAVDLVENKINGLIFKSQNLPDLIQSLKSLFHDKKEIKSMGLASYHKIQSWSFEEQVLAIKKQIKINAC